MYCPSCGMEIDDNSKFCSTCGEKITDVLNDLGIRYKSGDQSAFQEIYDDTVSWVRSYVYNRVSSNNVEDCLQSVYIKLFENISKFDETKGPFRAWFNTLVANETIDFLRKYEKPQNKNVDSLYDEEDKVIDIVDPGMSPEDVMEKQEVAQIMSEILAEISEDQRQCIMLRYMEGLKNKEIADIMGISEGTVKSRISYGLKRVEAKVIELEKQGTKLYSMAPLPFFVWIICRGNVAGLTISGNLWSNIAASTFGMSANAVAGVAVTAGGANAMAGMGTAMNAGIAAETGAVAGAEALTGAEALSGAGMSISSGISAEVGTAAGSEAMMGAGTSISAGISVETGAAGTGAVAEVSTGASAGAVAEVSTGSTTAAGGSATASAGATAGTGASASGATTVTGGMTKAGAGVAAGATGLAAMGLKGLLIKIFLGITIAAAAVGGGFGIKHLVEKAKKIESESESSIGKPTTEEVATATDADAVVIGDATTTDVAVAEYPEWIDAYVEKLQSLESETGEDASWMDIALFDIDTNGVPEMNVFSPSSDNYLRKLYAYEEGTVVDMGDGFMYELKGATIDETSQTLMVVGSRGYERDPWMFNVYQKDGLELVHNYCIIMQPDYEGGISVEMYGDEVDTNISYEEAKELLKPYIEIESYSINEVPAGGGPENTCLGLSLTYTANSQAIVVKPKNFDVENKKLDYEEVRQYMIDYYNGQSGESTTSVEVEYPEWIDKYIETAQGIDGLGKDKDIGLVDMEGDGIPEMLIYKSEYGNYGDKKIYNISDCIKLYSYDEGEIIEKELGTLDDYEEDTLNVFCLQLCSCSLEYSTISVNYDELRIRMKDYYYRRCGGVSDDWKQAYIDKVQELDNQGNYAIYILDIDNDGIPELFVDGKKDDPQAGVYTYFDDKVINIGNSGPMMPSIGVYFGNKYLDCWVYRVGYELDVYEETVIMKKVGNELICITYVVDNGNVIINENGEEKILSFEEANSYFSDYPVVINEFGGNEFGGSLVGGRNVYGGSHVIIENIEEY